MAYAAAVSLVQILKQLLCTNEYPFQFPRPQIELLHGRVCSLQSFLEEMVPVPRRWRNHVDRVEAQIRDAMYRAQDSIELFISRQIRSSEYEEIPGEQSPILADHLEEIIAQLDPIADEAEEIINSVGREMSFLAPSESMTNSTNRIVGQERDFKRLTEELLKDESQLQIIPITGLGGIGKTTLARSIYEYPGMQSQFPIRAWVTVCQEYQVGEIFVKLLDSMEIRGKKLWDKVRQGSVEQLSSQLYQALANTRYLIVLDDVWETKAFDDVITSFPDNKKGSRIILTTRISTVGESIKSSPFCHEMQPMNEDRSWALLNAKVFGDERHCPSPLEKIGRSITKNCRGQPLLISVVGGLLSKGRMQLAYWHVIEEDTYYAACKGEDARFEMLYMCYYHLPAQLRGCFLYMGAFPQDSEIPASKLIKFWIAEGFIVPPPPPQTLEQVAQQHLKELIDRNLILIRKKSSNGGIKSCSMHDDVRYLAMEESRRNNFFYSINGHSEELAEGTQSERRISVHKNFLMCRKDVYQRTKSNKLVRTLVYAGFDYHYPLPFCLTFELLRVLDALAVYFIELPNALFELIHLRYLAVTYNGKLPPSLSKLQNLQILIVDRHPKIIFIDSSILPVEFWSMLHMRHLLITEFDLPDPCGAQNPVILENLESLSNANAACCTKEVLQSMPNLKKLGIWVEVPGSVDIYLDQLQQLETLKFTVLKPIPGDEIDFLPELAFPLTLRKLSLCGCGIPWEDMKVIRELPCLEVLKLRKSAFQGPEWYQDKGLFRKLKFLLLESLDLVHLYAYYFCFPSLQRLIIRHCYELEKIEGDIGLIGPLELIELVDCSPGAVEWAEEVRAEQQGFDNYQLQVRIISSWE